MKNGQMERIAGVFMENITEAFEQTLQKLEKNELPTITP